MVSVTPILAPFLTISCLCARVCNRSFSISALYRAQWQLMTIGITFDNGPDGLSITPCLQVDPFIQNRMKVLQNYKS